MTFHVVGKCTGQDVEPGQAAEREATLVLEQENPRLRPVGAGMYWTASQRVMAGIEEDGTVKGDHLEFILTNGSMHLAKWSASAQEVSEEPSPIANMNDSDRGLVMKLLDLGNQEQRQWVAFLTRAGCEGADPACQPFLKRKSATTVRLPKAVRPSRRRRLPLCSALRYMDGRK
jgi:hypothetical protein